jgi:hypothetical protein
MKMGKKIDNSEKSTVAKNATDAPPVTPTKTETPPSNAASESEAPVANMKRINLNSLFVKPQV